MKTLFSFAIGAASLTLLSGCIPAASESTGGTDLSRSDVVKIVQQEMEKSPSLTESDVKAIVTAEVAEKVVGDALQMTDEDFNTKVAAGIESYIAEQEAAAKAAQEEANKPQKIEGVSADDDPFLGDENAPVTIIEFSDFECPFCARHISDVYPKIKENYIDTGKVKYVFRDLPLSFHANAIPAAVAANCVLEQAGNEEYFEFHDKLFANQKGLNEENFKSYAKDLGLNTEVYATCLETNDTAEVEKDMADGAALGVTGTPGFFINGWNIRGAYPYETFEELIEQELAAQ